MKATVALNNGVLRNGKCQPSSVARQVIHNDYKDAAGKLAAETKPYSVFLAAGKVRYVSCLMCIVYKYIMIFCF